jgi:hypothetical protein
MNYDIGNLSNQRIKLCRICLLAASRTHYPMQSEQFCAYQTQSHTIWGWRNVPLRCETVIASYEKNIMQLGTSQIRPISDGISYVAETELMIHPINKITKNTSKKP